MIIGVPKEIKEQEQRVAVRRGRQEFLRREPAGVLLVVVFGLAGCNDGAITAAAVRFSTLSLLKMCSTCLQMVPVLAARMTPMSWLLLPSEIQKRTSASRGVSFNEAKASMLR